MSERIRIAPRADEDIDEHFATIAAGAGVDVAARFHDRVYDTFRLLAWMPGAGQLRGFRRKRLATLRSWPVRGYRNYLIFYRRTRYGVEIVRVLHGARDIHRIFGD